MQVGSLFLLFIMAVSSLQFCNSSLLSSCDLQLACRIVHGSKILEQDESKMNELTSAAMIKAAVRHMSKGEMDSRHNDPGASEIRTRP